MKKVPVALLLVLAAALALAACGGSSSTTEATSETAPKESTSEGKEETEGGEEGGGEASTLKFETASTGLAYTSDTATAEAGNVTVEFSNGQPVPHDVAIETMNGEVLGQTETVSEGEDSTEIELKPGTYKFFCTVPGHREAGMEGTLTVK
jgi:plastocyanin